MVLGTPLFWLVAGLILCVMEFTLPTAFIELTMGISAIIVAGFALAVPSFGAQVALWLVLSVVLSFLLRRLFPYKQARQIEDSKEAETLTEIPAGQTGRVRYEGNSWQARCDDEQLTIAPDQKVYVVRRQGTTLIVMPEYLLRE
ncbi:NfeD family protein [Egbenema bharatensis]|uniref:NfeD family protein n=1 Tax=Egbenema bharatensis TaxID=3463334 RepID=UPI003A861B6C